MTSGDKIRYFLEEDAVTDGKLNRDKQKAVNKIGHGQGNVSVRIGLF